MAVTIINDTAFTEYLDGIVRIYQRAMGGVATDYGIGVSGGSYGAANHVADVINAVSDAIVDASTPSDGIDAVAALGSTAQGLKTSVDITAFVKLALADPVSSLQSHVASAQIAGAATIDSFLTLRNTGEAGKWKILMPPAFGDLWTRLFGETISVNNLWFEITQGSTYTNALGKLVVGTGFTAGTSVDTTKYAGGFPFIVASGLTGTGTVTVTGTAYDPATRTTSTGKTWTFALTTNGTFELVPGGSNAAPTDSLIVACSGVAVTGGISAGTLYVESHRPTGRDAFAYAP